MRSYTFRNVHQAIPYMLDRIVEEGEERETRNGPVLMFDSPVTTRYLKPRERVVFWPQRDANPFFHLMESLWMLSGRNDLAFVRQFISNFEMFSDDGETLYGAYGYRWRRFFGMDQLRVIATALKENPDCRRQVLQMWDAAMDLDKPGAKDLPCNTHIYFQRGGYGQLNMMVCCRSNDLLWGAYGANAVHFSMLQEYMAAQIGCDIGEYWQMSFNLHVYTSVLENSKILELVQFAPQERGRSDRYDLYACGDVSPMALVSSDSWDEECKMFVETNGGVIGMRDRFFRKVAVPAMRAHIAHREKRHSDAFCEADSIEALDWRRACLEWLERRAS